MWLDTFWIDLVCNSYTKNEKEQDLGDQKSMIGLLIINQVNRVVSYLKSKRQLRRRALMCDMGKLVECHGGRKIR